MTDFTDFMDLAARCAVEVLKDAKEVDVPFVIIVDTEGRLYIRVLGMDKQFFKRAIQEMLVRVNAKFYAFVSEAWYVLIEKEKMPPLKLARAHAWRISNV